MPAYELIYFPVRGKAEHIRYIFHQAGVPFTDTRLDKADWPKLKPETPFGQLPVLKVDGKFLAQSTAIARYVANEHGLNGDSAFEKALCDQYVDGIQADLYGKFVPVYRVLLNGGTKEEAMAEYEKFKAGDLKMFLGLYEKFLEKNGTGFLVGKKLTWADLTLAEFLERFERMWDAKVLEGFPQLAKLTKMVHDLPNIKKYTDSRPESTL